MLVPGRVDVRTCLFWGRCDETSAGLYDNDEIYNLILIMWFLLFCDFFF